MKGMEVKALKVDFSKKEEPSKTASLLNQEENTHLSYKIFKTIPPKLQEVMEANEVCSQSGNSKPSKRSLVLANRKKQKVINGNESIIQEHENLNNLSKKQ